MWQEESFVHTFAQLSRGVELIGAHGASATVLMTLSVPTDDVIFCVFVACSPEAVAQVCEYAGLPPQRVTAAVAIGD